MLAVVALVLDAVDGGSRGAPDASALGARFDMEVDAFLILVLSVLRRRIGRPVGARDRRGAVRVRRGRAGCCRGCAGRLPPRYWRKVVAAIQGIVLTSPWPTSCPTRLTVAALVLALVLLAESFGRDVWWLWQHGRIQTTRRTVEPRRIVIVPADVRPVVGVSGEHRQSTIGPDRIDHPTEPASSDADQPARSGRRAGCAPSPPGRTVLAALLVWFALVSPTSSTASARAPSSASRSKGCWSSRSLWSCRRGPDGRWRWSSASLLGVLTVVKILDMGFFAALGRPFSPVTDWSYFGPAVGVLRDSVGQTWAVVAVILAVLLVVAVLVFVTLSVAAPDPAHRAGIAPRRPGPSARSASSGSLCAALGVQVAAGAPVASTSAAGLAYDQVRQVRAAIRDQQEFAGTLTAADSFREHARPRTC